MGHGGVKRRIYEAQAECLPLLCLELSVLHWYTTGRIMAGKAAHNRSTMICSH